MMMDHFNITIQDGAMVSTRRGLQVSKQKHNGTAFINSSANDIASAKPKSRSNTSLPLPGGITFVNNGGDGRKSKRRSRQAGDKDSVPRLSGSGVRKAAPRTCRVSPCPTLSSSSPSTSVSEDFMLEDQPVTYNAENQCRPAARNLPPWASYKLAQDDTNSDDRLQFMTLAFNPRVDDDPSTLKREDIFQKSMWTMQNPTSLHCALALGALFDAIKSGKQDTPALNSLASQLCSIVNRRVSENDQSKEACDVTIRAIAALAIISAYQGKPDHWYVHMRGLVNLTYLAGGQERLHPGTINVIRKADVVGAISAASKPCMTFASLVNTKFGTSIKTLGRPSHIVYQQLKSLHLNTDVAETIVAVAEFASSFGSDHSLTTIPFRHHSKDNLDQFYDLTYRLLSIPEPLRDFEEVISPFRSIELSLHNQDIPTSEHQNTAVPDTTTKAIELALRILVLMFLKSQILEIPCGETILLQLLQQQLSAILSERQLNHNEESFVSQAAHHESKMLQRPILIWICIAGELFTNSISSNEDNDALRQYTIHIELLRDVLTAEEVADAGLISDNDLLFCKCLDLRYLKGKTWDERHIIRYMMGEIDL